MQDIRQANALRHEHVANLWASYTSEDAGYILSDFVGEHTLSTFIDHRTPMQFMRIPVAQRPALLLEWIHCLSDALASLHHRGTAHAAIRPSNILIDHDNHIAFADVGALRTFQRGKKPQKTETYDYAAPESQVSKAPIVVPSSPPAAKDELEHERLFDRPAYWQQHPEQQLMPYRAHQPANLSTLHGQGSLK
ncbi:hypothetical protein D0865_12659 [Hortaea werneckii]|uniref:non-specific serine/threonine protein kinase n=1 Tax=Hortaea werneckii TaxID=91943 RepID=A0A3M7BJT3_HORWE|nr:hypothetical protein D0865_12659 [Hortaea werneckii]